MGVGSQRHAPAALPPGISLYIYIYMYSLHNVEIPDSWLYGTMCTPFLPIRKKVDSSALREGVNKQ